MEIPRQLINHRFIKTVEKQPIEKEWTTYNNYSHNEMLVAKPTTYGVLCGYNKLMVVDCDLQEAEDYCLTHPKLKNTFITKTASKKLMHFYIYVDVEDPQTKRFKHKTKVDSNGKPLSVLDLQGKSTQVIGPTSKLKNGSEYIVYQDNPIINITYKEVITFLSTRFNYKKPEKKKHLSGDYVEIDPVIKFIKSNTTIQNVLDLCKIDTEGNPGKCPTGHDSKSNKCFLYTDEVYHCFNCEIRGNIFHLYMELKKCNFPQAVEDLGNYCGISDALRKQALQFIASQKKEELSELIVSEFLKLYPTHTTRDFERSEVWIYKDGIYIPNGDTYIQEYCRAILKEFYTTHRCNQIIAKIAADTYINQEEFFVNQNIKKIPLENGILDLFTRKIEPFSPKYKFFVKLPVVYNKNAVAHKFTQFQNDIHSGADDIKVNQEMYGFCLYREYKFEKAMMKIGNGRNGKSKDIECLKFLLGTKNCVSIPVHQLEKDKFSLGELHNKMANLGADLESSELKTTHNFKRLTGHDNITASRKFKTPIEFTNYAKLIFATNKLPEVPNDDSIGFADRWILVEYPYTFKLKTEYDDYSPEERIKQKIKLADTDLINKLTTPEEMSGILNWALDGLDRLFSQKGFTKSNTDNKNNKIWKRKASSAAAFIEDSLDITFNPDDYIKVIDMNMEYKKYCMKHKVAPEKLNQFKEKIDTAGISFEKKNKTTVGEGVIHCYCGVNFK